MRKRAVSVILSLLTALNLAALAMTLAAIWAASPLA